MLSSGSPEDTVVGPMHVAVPVASGTAMVNRISPGIRLMLFDEEVPQFCLHFLQHVYRRGIRIVSGNRVLDDEAIVLTWSH